MVSQKTPETTLSDDHPRAVLDVHEEEDDEGRLDDGDPHRHDVVERAEVDVGGGDGERGADHQGEEDQDVGADRGNVRRPSRRLPIR